MTQEQIDKMTHEELLNEANSILDRIEESFIKSMSEEECLQKIQLLIECFNKFDEAYPK